MPVCQTNDIQEEAMPVCQANVRKRVHFPSNNSSHDSSLKRQCKEDCSQNIEAQKDISEEGGQLMTETAINQMVKKNKVMKSHIQNMNKELDTVIAQQEAMLSFVYHLLSVVQK